MLPIECVEFMDAAKKLVDLKLARQDYHIQFMPNDPFLEFYEHIAWSVHTKDGCRRCWLWFWKKD